MARRMRVAKGRGPLTVTTAAIEHGRGEFWVQVIDVETKDTDVLEGVDLARFRFQERDGTLVCTGLHLETSEELQARGLHDVPFGALRDEAVQWAALKSRAKPPPTSAERRRGRRGHPDEFYAELAELYRFALRWHPRAPVKWIADEGHQHSPVDPETVRSWLRKARDKGYLGKSTPGKAGEQTVNPRKRGRRKR